MGGPDFLTDTVSYRLSPIKANTSYTGDSFERRKDFSRTFGRSAVRRNFEIEKFTVRSALVDETPQYFDPPEADRRKGSH